MTTSLSIRASQRPNGRGNSLERKKLKIYLWIQMTLTRSSRKTLAAVRQDSSTRLAVIAKHETYRTLNIPKEKVEFYNNQGRKPNEISRFLMTLLMEK